MPRSAFCATRLGRGAVRAFPGACFFYYFFFNLVGKKSKDKLVGNEVSAPQRDFMMNNEETEDSL